MRYLFILFLFGTFPLAAQSTSGFHLDLGIGKAFARESFVSNRAAFSLGISYQHPVSYRFSLVGGLGVQRQDTEAITANGEPCVFPLGIKVTSFLNNESYTTRTTEAFARLGAAYNFRQFQLSIAALPAYRLGGDIGYVYSRDFTNPSRPDAVIDTRISNGESIDRSALGGGPRQVLLDEFNLHAEIKLGYTFADKLWLGLAWRPTLTQNNLNYRDLSFCTPDFCADLNEEIETAGTLRSNTLLLLAGFDF